MKYRLLGKTSLQVSVLGFGGSPLGGVFGAVDAEECRRTVHAALEQGINFFDVAPFYGQTKAEIMLGACLQGISRDRYILATKVGRYGSAEFDFSAERVLRSIEESLQRLQTDHIDLIQCHDIEFGSIEQVIHETLPALRKVRDQGKVRFIGVSGLPLAIFPKVLEQAELDTVLSYCHYTLQDDSLTSLLPYFETKQVGTINASPLAMGLLTEQNLPEWHPAPEGVKSACRQAAAFCRSRGEDISRLALQFSLANPQIAVTLVGMSKREELEKNLACVDSLPEPELLEEVLRRLAPIHNQSWPSGRPENS